jgi:hypothetical protein
LPLSKPLAAEQGRQVPEAQATMVSLTFGTIDYPNRPQTVAQAINKKDEIVGSWGPDINDYRQSLPAYGLAPKGSSFKKIVYPSAPITVPFGVNNSGEIVAYYSLDPQDNSGYGFTLAGTKFASVTCPGAMHTALVAINKSGQILTLTSFSTGAPCRGMQPGAHHTTQLPRYPGSAPPLYCSKAQQVSGAIDAHRSLG